ncbi:MAG: RNA-binding protein [Bacteroidetes bacterium]|nr:MAG: RNA-binding protein [Bacteroidota bacterium]
MKLFVAKLNRETTENDLKEHFGQFGGVVSVKVVTDRETDQSKCFGFIEMDSKEAGDAAIQNQNGEEFMGFRMVVKEAEDKPRAPRPPGGVRSGGFNRGGGGAPNGNSDNKSSTSRSGASDSRGDQGATKTFSSNATKKRAPNKKGKGGPDKYADGARSSQHAKRPKSNRNQWLDDLDDF